jgi:general secretion pathway protein J
VTPTRRAAASGFTLIELLVALAVLAVLALMSWRGVDGMARAQSQVAARMDGTSTLQVGLNQWTADLDASFDTALVSSVDFDGRVLRLTRRDTATPGSPLRVVGWTRRLAGDASGQGAGGVWARWQSLPVTTSADLLEAWSQAALWGQNPGDAEKQREVVVAGLEGWQVYFYRGGAWSNAQSAAGGTVGAPPPPAAPASAAARAPGAAFAPAASASASGADAPPTATTSTVAPIPEGVRLILQLPAGQPLAGTLVKDWIRPT